MSEQKTGPEGGWAENVTPEVMAYFERNDKIRSDFSVANAELARVLGDIGNVIEMPIVRTNTEIDSQVQSKREELIGKMKELAQFASKEC